jgi:uncharacterized protein involved in exopolysaccharide biosynthesis
MELENQEPENQGGAANQLELLKSYWSFIRRSVAARRWPVTAIFVLVASLAAVIAAILPVNYHCEMRLIALNNSVLEDDKKAPLAGAREIIKRFESLTTLAKRADLVRRWDADRPPLYRFKDQMMAKLRGGGPSDADKLNAIVNSLDGRILVSSEDFTLTIGVDWPNAETSAVIVDTAKQTFLEARHAEEISTILERISILDDHAGKLREEIDGIVDQVQRLREDKAAQAEKDKSQRAADAPAPTIRRPVRIAPPPDEELPALKDELEAKKKSIADLEADRARRLVEAQARLSETRLKYTPAHPAALAAEQTIASLSHESAQVSTLRTEVKQLEADIKKRIEDKPSAGLAGGGGGDGIAPLPAGSSASKSEVLPPDVMWLLDSGAGAGIDPTVTAHLYNAVSEYTALRDSIRKRRIELDTAQAAFNHRYQILVPVEVPLKPMKTKGPIIVVGGLIMGLLIALAYAIAGELRRGIVVERWQVQAMELPILAELRLPPSSNE